ncbi:MAG: GNAT family N-acetyltransferase [Rhodospirillaceae bacterium]|nr:GNAT family N-acetyltransferase [Rhodospirillaceae bacterium]MBT6609768.1 GNAT family N-acetyltransferase [Rhodospirillaceae bacterium]
MIFSDRIAAVENFYAARNQPPRFQVTRGSLPDGLDDELEQRGYEVEAPVDIQITRAEAMTTPASAEGTIHVGDELTPAWTEVYAAGFNRDVSAVIKQITGHPAFLTFQRDDEVLGVALGVYESAWLGIFGMQTRQSMRGKGIGSLMLKGLADWAVAQGALGLYLQVEQSNPRARALYERFGFRTVYAYHYRTLF